MKKITQDQLNEVIRLHGLWLKNDPKGVRLDLSYCELIGLTVTGACLDGCTFVGSTFDGCTFVSCTFEDSRFVGSTFDSCTFIGIRFDDSRFVGITFDRCTFIGANGEQLITSAAMGWSGLCSCYVFALVSDKGPWVRMGCHWRSLADWEAEFWNNPDEFPNDGSAKSNMRLAAYNFAKEWIKNNS